VISRCAAELCFSAAFCVSPRAEDGAPERVKTFLLLVREYIPGGTLVDRFYPASNAAYHAAGELAARLSDLCGQSVMRLPSVRLKALCGRIPAFGQGVNTLNYLPNIGSRFCMELLGLPFAVAQETAMDAFPAEKLPCAACRRCMHACPTGAITEKGFIKERCIRFYMINGKPMPTSMRGAIGAVRGVRGIVGCDVCQLVCPENAAKEAERQEADDFTLDELLCCDQQTLQRFADLYGRNYAIRNRIIAQAILAAANTRRADLLSQLDELRGSASPAVSQHAAWAMDKLQEKEK